MPKLWQLLAVAVIASPVATAQDAPDVRYWSLREINFPVPAENLARDPSKPKRLHFFVDDGGGWREEAARGLTDLDLIDADSGKKGFRFVSPRDGAYNFALQVETETGELFPRTADLKPQYRVIVDTRPPLVRAARVGKAGLQWEVTDENLADDGVRLEARWVRDSLSPDENFDGARFVPVSPGGFRPKAVDQFTWTALRPGDVLEVRVVGRDKANQETPSPPVRLPGDGDGPGLGEASIGSGYGNPDDFDRGPKKLYSNTHNLKITSKLQTVTRSGVVKSHLWVRDAAMKWVKVGHQDQKIDGGATNAVIDWNHAVKADGLYGFIVIPENAAEKKDPDPRPGDPAQQLIEVDTVAPVAKITDARVYGTGNAPRVEIRWTAKDLNFDRSPIRLEYTENPSPSEADWKPVHPAPPTLANSGTYPWAVDNPKLWKFRLRIRAVDLAGNETKTPFEKDVIVDLDTPKATIETIAGNGKSPQVNEPTGGGLLKTGGSAEPSRLPIPPPAVPPPSADGNPAVPKLPPVPEQKPPTS